MLNPWAVWLASDLNLTQSFLERAVKAVGFVIVFVNSCVNLESGEDDFRITNASDDFSPSEAEKETKGQNDKMTKLEKTRDTMTKGKIHYGKRKNEK